VSGLGDWRACPGCGYSKAMSPADEVCHACASRGITEPEPLAAFDFGPGQRHLRAVPNLDGTDALDHLDRMAWLELAEVRGRVIDIEIRHEALP
jgi:hypothetical protein